MGRLNLGAHRTMSPSKNQMEKKKKKRIESSVTDVVFLH